MSKREIKCVQCGSQVKKATDITLITAVEGREVVVTGLTGTRCPTCGEEYADAESAEKVEEVIKKFRKPTVISLIFCVLLILLSCPYPYNSSKI
ncbi:MAG: YgiT-type zinc finger protein [Candidatus Methanoperedens sp.]|nr:YgiT-type zinc finger protein [Candidatus Methanoperedens sp.]